MVRDEDGDHRRPMHISSARRVLSGDCFGVLSFWDPVFLGPDRIWNNMGMQGARIP